eukprot:48071-Rhodomonas_salina.2
MMMMVRLQRLCLRVPLRHMEPRLSIPRRMASTRPKSASTRPTSATGSNSGWTASGISLMIQPSLTSGGAYSSVLSPGNQGMYKGMRRAATHTLVTVTQRRPHHAWNQNSGSDSVASL